MIGQLKGSLIVKQPPDLLIDVHGVGYELQASMNTFYRLPDIGTEITLHTHFVVREDAQLLFGFYDPRERELFRTLIKVNGVGPKLAITLLSSIDPDAFVECISAQDTASLVSLPGIGQKTAQRLIVEMRDRLSGWFEGEHAISATHHGAKKPSHDAISALVALGYKPQEASRAVSKVDTGQLESEKIIRQALQELA